MAPPPPALETVTPCIGPPESLASASPTDAAPDASMTQADAVPPYLPLLMELSAHVLDRPDFNTVVTYLLEGLHRGCGFAHVALVLPQTATRTLVARFGVGPDTDDRLPAFTSPADPEANFLMRVMAERVPVRMTRREPPTVPLPPALADLGGAHAVALGPLHNATRTVGLIWADHARAIDDATWNAFQLFIMQANIALTRLAK
jgi:transcriptional regulator with GAF, ATPase, and Fis domain